MSAMTPQDIAHLADLARIKLTDAEREQLAGEIDTILEYVSAVQEIAGDDGDATPTVGPLHNVFRSDEVTTPPGTHTETLLAAMPQREGQYLKVQKILSQDE